MMNLEMSSNEEDDSSTSTVAWGNEGIRQLERMMVASSTPGTLKDIANNHIAPDVDWGHVRPAPTDFLGRGKTEIPESAARHSFGEHIPSQGGVEAQNDPNKANHVIVALSQCQIRISSNIDLQEASELHQGFIR